MASPLFAYNVHHATIPDDQINPQDPSIKLVININRNRVFNQITFDFSNDETQFDGLSNFLNDSGIDSEDIETIVFDLSRQSQHAREVLVEGFKGVVILIATIIIFPPVESNEIPEMDYETRFEPAGRAFIRALKTIEFKKQNAETASCAICLDDFVDGLMLKRLPCGHEFHGDCIVEWLNTSRLCPLCRFKLPCEEE